MPACADKALLTTLAREKWGFEGLWVSDCGALNDVQANHLYTSNANETVIAALNAGLDVNCGEIYQENLGAVLGAGNVSVSTVKQSLKRVYDFRMR